MHTAGTASVARGRSNGVILKAWGSVGRRPSACEAAPLSQESTGAHKHPRRPGNPHPALALCPRREGSPRARPEAGGAQLTEPTREPVTPSDCFKVTCNAKQGEALNTALTLAASLARCACWAADGQRRVTRETG